MGGLTRSALPLGYCYYCYYYSGSPDTVLEQNLVCRLFFSHFIGWVDDHFVFVLTCFIIDFGSLQNCKVWPVGSVVLFKRPTSKIIHTILFNVCHLLDRHINGNQKLVRWRMMFHGTSMHTVHCVC